jgi:hypothetical protein
MAIDTWEQATQEEKGETVGYGSDKCGRLSVEYLDGHWEFGIELAVGWEDTVADEDEERKTTLILANKKELGA